MEEDVVRERMVRWEDPWQSAQKATQMAGLDFLQAIAGGEISQPPIAHLINMKLGEAAPGRVQFVLVVDESLFNPIGTVHGGIIAAACDSAASCAVQTELPLGMVYTTLEMKVNYIRPLTLKTPLLRCMGEVVHVGRRVGTATARLEDEGGKLYAHATVTCLIFPTA